MADQEVGIKVVAKDFASKVFVGVGKAAKGTATQVNKLPSAFGNAARKLGVFSVMANQAFELWAKVRERVLNSTKAMIDASMQFRSATDPMRMWWEDQAKGIEQTKASIGDVLLPVLKGMSDAVNEVGVSLKDWLRQNRLLITSKLLGWFDAAGKGLGKLVQMFGYVGQAASIFKAAIWGVASLFDDFIGSMLEGTGDLIGRLGDVAAVLGAKGVAAKLRGAREATKDWAGIFYKSADEAVDSAAEVGSELEAIRAKANSVANSITRVTGRMVELGRAAAASDTGAGGGAGGKTEAGILAARESTLAKLNGIIDKYVTEQEAKYAKDANNFKQSEESKKLIVQDVSNAMAAATNAWASSVVDSQNTAKDNAAVVFKSIVASAVSAAQKMIMTNAVLAATSAAPGAAASSGIAAPIVVPAVMATIVGIVQAYMTKMALGGEVRGGVPGRDSVPALLKPGELVLNESQARRAKKEGKTQAPVSVSVTLHQSSLIPDADMSQRAVDAIGPAIEAAIREGRLQVGVT